ncbi:sensor histidine kinase [Jeotgalibacillus sp. ET6]|uniref:cache domain-containing sensor histidine kinase n=1 Tax=Jeotgalibacillus sp. ET6 TaxID=3037260 RepID=UPI0024187CC4|nr:sensor histidine kinase [Jeotgalibacillus sp. ET6]MDG5473213.1 sensor histidine kinase [Jeotgalibacillus sp. ET6]
MKKWLLLRFNNMKLPEKFIWFFLIIVVFPILSAGIYLTNEMRQDALDDAITQSALNNERVRQRTSEVLRVPVFVSNNLMFDDRLRMLVNTRFTRTNEVVEAYRSFNTFSYYKQYYPDIQSIRLYTQNQTMINNWELIPLNETIMDETWYREAAADAGFMKWQYIEDETKGGKPYLSLIRRINFLEEKSFAILIITINPAVLDVILNQEMFLTMIVDENDHIVASNDPSNKGQKLGTILDDSTEDDEEALYEAVVDGNASQIITSDILIDELSQNRLRVVTAVQHHHIVGNANALAAKGALMTVLAALVAIGFIAIMSRLFSKRLDELSARISRVATGDLSTSVEMSGNDEIGELSRQFQHMVEELDASIETLKESNSQKAQLQRNQADIKLKMMASQINPHFLFNTLESIRMKAHMEGAKEAAGIVKLLGKLMRKSIETGGRPVRVEMEIEMVRCYLEIQSFRYEKRLSYDLFVDPSAKDVYIEPLIIQPLVENSVIHGLEDKDDGGKVSVYVQMVSGGMKVTVKDDGKGFTEKRLFEVLHFINDTEEENRIGLRNVHQRLLLTYGDSSGLQIRSDEGEGTVIHFVIPIQGE